MPETSFESLFASIVNLLSLNSTLVKSSVVSFSKPFSVLRTATTSSFVTFSLANLFSSSLTLSLSLSKSTLTFSFSVVPGSVVPGSLLLLLSLVSVLSHLAATNGIALKIDSEPSDSNNLFFS
nr:hypothetical protein [Mycoplasmopsis bovis]